MTTAGVGPGHSTGTGTGCDAPAAVPIRVLLVDDHTVFRAGLRRLFLDEPDVQVSAEASSAAQAMALMRDGTAAHDLMLLDINLAGRSGLDLLATLRAEGWLLPVLVLSMHPAPQMAPVALAAGAQGYLPKDVAPAELMQAMRCVAAGGRYLGDELRQLLDPPGPPHRAAPPPPQRLSAREHEVMMALVHGHSLTETGRLLNISVKTVSTHRSHLLDKLGLASNAELVLHAVRQGLLDGTPRAAPPR